MLFKRLLQLRRLSQPIARNVQKTTRVLFSKRYLLMTNTGITVCLGCLGDILQQNYEIICKRQQVLDELRTSQVMLTGFVIGPTCHFWYRFLERVYPGNTLKLVAKKVLVDQIVFSPINIGLFLFMIGYLNGGNMSSIMKDLKEKGLDLLKAEWVIWPPAQIINFCFVPYKFRVLYDNSVSLAFDSYYSYVTFSRDRHRILEKINVDNILEDPDNTKQCQYIEESVEELESDFAGKPHVPAEWLNYTCRIARYHLH